MSAAAYPSRIVRGRARRGHRRFLPLARTLALVVAAAALIVVGFLVAAQLGSTSSPPIQSREPAVTSGP